MIQRELISQERKSKGKIILVNCTTKYRYLMNS